MPFKSEKQRRYLWANEPEIARDWTDTYGSKIHAADGGRMRAPLWRGGLPDFFQMTPEKIAEAKNLSWKDAWNLEKKYKYNPKYPGGVSKGKYTLEGLKSLVGMGDPKIGGASPLTRKLGLGAMRGLRAGTPVGLLSLGAEGFYNAHQKEMAKRAQMSPEELDAYMLENKSRGWSKMGEGKVDREKRGTGLMPEKRLPDREALAFAARRNRTNTPYVSPHTNMKLNTQDRGALLAKLLKEDPASDLYDYSTIASYDEDPNLERAKRHEKAKDLGYHPSGGKSYVRGLEDLGNVTGEFGTSERDKALAATAGHEFTHGLLETDPFSNIVEEMNLSKPRSAYGEGWFDKESGKFHEGTETYMPHEEEELLVRLLDAQRYNEDLGFGTKEEQATDWYLGQSPYAISKHPSGEYGVEGLKKTLTRHSDKFYNRVDERKNYLRQQNAMQQMMNAPLGSRAPRSWKDRVGNRFRGTKDAIGRGITGAWNAVTGFPGMALNAFRGPQLTQAQKDMNNQFFQKYNVGRAPPTMGGGMTGGPFAGMNAPGTSAFGSPTSQAMAQKWLGKYGDVDHYSQAMKDKKQTMLDLASVNTVNPVGGVDQISKGGNQGNNMGMAQGNTGGAQLGSGMTTGQHAAFRKAQGGLISLWPR